MFKKVERPPYDAAQEERVLRQIAWHARMLQPPIMRTQRKMTDAERIESMRAASRKYVATRRAKERVAREAKRKATA